MRKREHESHAQTHTRHTPTHVGTPCAGPNSENVSFFAIKQCLRYRAAISERETPHWLSDPAKTQRTKTSQPRAGKEPRMSCLDPRVRGGLPRKRCALKQTTGILLRKQSGQGGCTKLGCEVQSRVLLRQFADRSLQAHVFLCIGDAVSNVQVGDLVG